MADKYVSSTAYAAIPTFQTNHVYSVGDIVRPTAPGQTAQYPQRCTTAGTSGGTEPGWSNSDNGTTSTGATCVFTNVAGQSTYGWSAAIGNVISITQNSSGKHASANDRVFVSSDHSESITGTGNYQISASNDFGTIKMISVNKAGSVPPVAADLQSGAAITTSGDLVFDSHTTTYWDGFIFTLSGNNTCNLNNGGGDKTQYFKNCQFVFGSASGGFFDNTQGTCKIVFDNTTIKVASTGFTFKASKTFDFTWINTPSAFAGSTAQPSSLFNGNNGSGLLVGTIRGVDLSYLTGTLLAGSFATGGMQILLDSCKINSSVTRYQTPSNGNSLISCDMIELVNCFDGTNFFSERYTPHGTVTTDRSTYMNTGAADDIGSYSRKMVTNGSPTSELVAGAMETFWMDVQNAVVGSVLTASVEIISSGSLNNVDIKLQLEYQGTSGSTVTSFIESNANVLTASAAVPSSSASWNSPPATPVAQKLQASFTPQKAGRVRGRVLLGAASKTVWVNPQIKAA
ncbi:hypothetical protein H8A97_13065 [Bradyrhizobium sp. Arg62]|uniref:hypothetical protein n=1 Tax=Bradyrhizobium brasilense TaxID=1419277 RepID=UPI001E3F3E2A|nr:hypothetical protein [Bradyrhizobium brasilense]MCC8946004.1 hypothetical protein [Bradyrhizobium brasilense]